MLWFFRDDARFDAPARALIEDSDDRKLISVASCSEVAGEGRVGKTRLGDSSRSFLPREITRNNFELLPIKS